MLLKKKIVTNPSITSQASPAKSNHTKQCTMFPSADSHFWLKLQAIFVQTVRCACAFAEGDLVLCPFCALLMVRKGWSVMEIPSDGWVKVCERRPP